LSQPIKIPCPNWPHCQCLELDPCTHSDGERHMVCDLAVTVEQFHWEAKNEPLTITEAA
jgi:hypothetical protein